MRIEDIITIINNRIEETRKRLNINAKGHLVVSRSIDINKSFKAYKTYIIELWYIHYPNIMSCPKKYKIFRTGLTGKVLQGQEETIKEDCDNKFMYSIFELLESEYYQQMIRGEYYGGADTE